MSIELIDPFTQHPLTIVDDGLKQNDVVVFSKIKFNPFPNNQLRFCRSQ